MTKEAEIEALFVSEFLKIASDPDRQYRSWQIGELRVWKDERNGPVMVSPAGAEAIAHRLQVAEDILRAGA